MQIFDTPGHRFAIGLRWYDLLDATNPRKELARLLGENHQARYGVLSEVEEASGGFTTVGIVPGDEPLEKGRTYSLAATIAAQEPAAIVLYELSEDLWWGCAVYGHAVMPQGDVYGTADEVVASVTRWLERAPEMTVRGTGLDVFGFDHYEEKPLEEYLNDESQFVQIASLQGRSLKSTVVMAAVVVAVLGAAYWAYQSLVAMPTPVARQHLTPAQRARLLKRAYLSRVRQRAYHAFPAGSRWVRRIEARISAPEYPLFAGGWQLLGAQCNTPAAGCSLIWQAYAPGRLRRLSREVDMPYSAFKLDPKGTTAKVFVPFTKMRPSLSVNQASPTVRELAALPTEQWVVNKWTESMRHLSLLIPGLKWHGSAASAVPSVAPAPRGLPTNLVVGTVAASGRTSFALKRVLATTDALHMSPVVYNYALQSGAHAGGWKVEFKYVAKK